MLLWTIVCLSVGLPQTSKDMQEKQEETIPRSGSSQGKYNTKAQDPHAQTKQEGRKYRPERRAKRWGGSEYTLPPHIFLDLIPGLLGCNYLCQRNKACETP
jgi:hypothetical protein